MTDHRQLASPLTTSGMLKYMSFLTHRFHQDAIWAFAELGIADLLAAIGKPQTAAEVAVSQGWHSELLYRLLRTVADADIVRELKSDNAHDSLDAEKTHQFELTENGRMLTSDHPSKARYMLRFGLSPLLKKASTFLPDLVRHGYSKGNGIEQATGNQSMFDYLKDDRNRDMASWFNEHMTASATHTAEALSDAMNFSSFRTLADIGGNYGITLATILSKYPTIEFGTCFDLPHVVQDQSVNAREFEQRNVPRDRYRFMGGDMFDAKTLPHANAYMFKSILHDWSDDQCIDILKCVRTAVKEQPVTVLIIERVILPETGLCQR